MWIYFPGLQAVVSFLRLAAQPHFSRRLLDDSRWYPRERKQMVGGRTKTEWTLWAHLPHATSEDTSVGETLRLIGGSGRPLGKGSAGDGEIRIAEAQPELGEGKCLSLGELLRAFKLGSGGRPGRGRQDMLITLDASAAPRLAEIFESVRKNPDSPAKVFELEHEDTGAGKPLAMIALPQADPSMSWSLWLHTENQLAGAGVGPPAVRLYYKLPGDLTAEYFVEYGYDHPIPELPELYPLETRANYVLIGIRWESQGDQTTASSGGIAPEVRRARWLEITPGSESARPIARLAADVPVHLDLSADPAVIAAQSLTLQEPLKLTARVATLELERRNTLIGLDKRIQAAKSHLFDLERQRGEFLDRQGGRYSVVLLFSQPQAAGAVAPSAESGGEAWAQELAAAPPLCHGFEMFLLQSRRQLADFDYAFLADALGNGHASPTGESAPGGTPPRLGWHVLVTHKPFLLQDLSLGLADECGVFIQPQHWLDWCPDVFVRQDAQLLPAIDDESLGRGLNESVANLKGHLGANGFDSDLGGRTLFLLSPGAGDEAKMQVTVLQVPTGANLKWQLDPINRRHPLPEWLGRQEAARDYREVLEQMQLDLQQQVERVGRTLVERATQRLNRARHEWSDFAPQLDRAGRQVQLCHDRLRTLEEVVRDFALSWRGFVDLVVDLNSGLIKEKLEWLAKLDRKKEEWEKTLADIVRGCEDVEKSIKDIEGDLPEHYSDAKDKHAKAKTAYEDFEKRVTPVLEHVTRLSAEIGNWLKKAVGVTEQVEDKNRELESRLDRSREVQKALEDATKRLQHLLKAFESALKSAETACKDLLVQVERLDDLKRKIEQNERDWKAEHDRAFAKEGEVDRACKEARESAQKLEDEWKLREEKARVAVAEVDKAFKRVQAAAVAARGALADLDVLADKLRRRVEEFDSVVQDMEKRRKEIEDLLARLGTQHGAIAAQRKAWDASAKKNEEEHGKLKEAIAAAEDALNQRKAELTRLEQLASQACDDLDSKSAEVARRQAELGRTIVEIQGRLDILQGENATLQKIKDQLDKTNQELDDENVNKQTLERGLLAAAKTLGDHLRETREGAAKRLDDLRKGLLDTVEILRQLVRLEEAWPPLHDLHPPLARSQPAISVLATLSNEQWELIWKE